MSNHVTGLAKLNSRYSTSPGIAVLESSSMFKNAFVLLPLDHSTSSGSLDLYIKKH